MEEYGDVVNCIEVLLTGKQRDLAMEMRKTKLIRWVNRLAYRKNQTLGNADHLVNVLDGIERPVLPKGED